MTPIVRSQCRLVVDALLNHVLISKWSIGQQHVTQQLSMRCCQHFATLAHVYVAASRIRTRRTSHLVTLRITVMVCYHTILLYRYQ